VGAGANMPPGRVLSLRLSLPPELVCGRLKQIE